MSQLALVELCAGTASLSLWVLGRGKPLVGYMGSKRRFSDLLASYLCGSERPDRVVLVDAGPWGDAWQTLRAPGARIDCARLLRAWAAEDPSALWRRLLVPPAEDPVARVAQYLWLQGRSAGTIPVWWSPENGRWESPTGSRIEAAHERGLGPAYEAGGIGRRRAERGGAACQKGGTGRGCRGIQSPATIAARLDALAALPWDRIEVIHGDLRLVTPIPGARVYFDPPYLGCPRYAALCPRSDVRATAERWAQVGARVLVSEAAPLDLPGWSSIPLPGATRPEWLTASWPIRSAQGMPLFVEVA